MHYFIASSHKTQCYNRSTDYADATNKSRIVDVKARKSSNVQRKLLSWNSKLN